MSAALSLPSIWSAGASIPERKLREAPSEVDERESATQTQAAEEERENALRSSRNRTESLLRRYLYTSMQIGRAPSVLGEQVIRGRASSRTLRTFEDSVIFVLDVEACLDRLNSLDREVLSRIVLQEYTHAETGALLGIGVRTIAYKFPRALDHLTERLLEAGLLERSQ